jgi:hypothetical protein
MAMITQNFEQRLELRNNDNFWANQEIMYQYARDLPANSQQRGVILEQMRDDIMTEVIARSMMVKSAIQQAKEHEED